MLGLDREHHPARDHGELGPVAEVVKKPGAGGRPDGLGRHRAVDVGLSCFCTSMFQPSGSNLP